MNKIDDTKNLLSKWAELGVKIETLTEAHKKFFDNLQEVVNNVFDRVYTHEEALTKVAEVRQEYERIVKLREDLIGSIDEIERLWMRTNLAFPANFQEMKEAAVSSADVDLTKLIDRLDEVVVMKYVLSPKIKKEGD